MQHAAAKHGDDCGDQSDGVRPGSATGVHARLLRSLSGERVTKQSTSFSVVALRSRRAHLHELERYARGPPASLIRVEQKESHQEEKY